ncbi:MAG: hypothetical protein LBT36_03985 [Oscillospiraceae bacterium]|jgi:oxalate decarboxylase/phosphoglucose isomerase-like protein (cupin superfamily)|nr:hypothetical protein [Oscillospiraceae bacterium]
MKKYGDLVFTIPQEWHSWYGFASPRGFFRGTTMMEKAHLYMDFTAVTKDLVMEVPHVHHAVDEYIVLTGADMNNFFDFDAEVDIWLGDDPERMEMFTITQPTIIRIPPKLYHCPLNFRNINESKPIVFSAIYCDGDWSKISPRKLENGQEEFVYDGAGVRRCVKDRSKECIYCGACFSEGLKELAEQPKQEDTPQSQLLAPYYEMAKLPRTGKYDKYVYAFKPETHSDPRFLSPRAGFRGTDEMPESRLRYFYNIIQQPCEVGELHMHHAVEEYLWFTGADIAKFFEFDAEIEISLGASPNDMETFTITEPTIIRVPAGYWHSAAKFKRVGAPVNFTPFYPSGDYGKVLQRNGEYVYEGTDLPK